MDTGEDLNVQRPQSAEVNLAGGRRTKFFVYSRLLCNIAMLSQKHMAIAEVNDNARKAFTLACIMK